MQQPSKSRKGKPALTDAGPARLQPLPRKSLSELTLDFIRAAIHNGDSLPGERLVEQTLARQLNVSRGPVRDALRELEREGLVVSQLNRGTYVSHLKHDDLEEIYSLRLVLEQLAMRLACRHADDTHLAEMNKLIDEMTAAVSEGLTARECVEFDLRFHDEIYAASAHKRLIGFWEILRPQVKTFLLERNTELKDYSDIVVPFHRELLDVIIRKDEDEAVRLIRSHIDNAFEPLAKRQDRSDATGPLAR